MNTKQLYIMPVGVHITSLSILFDKVIPTWYHRRLCQLLLLSSSICQIFIPYVLWCDAILCFGAFLSLMFFLCTCQYQAMVVTDIMPILAIIWHYKYVNNIKIRSTYLSSTLIITRNEDMWRVIITMWPQLLLLQ